VSVLVADVDFATAPLPVIFPDRTWSTDDP
jgi:hypothetical protein